MSIKREEYGVAKTGEIVYCYTLDNEKGLSAKILTYGGIIKNLYATDRDGNKVDVVLGRETMEDYFKNDGYLGALIGRHANRIAKSTFTINGIEYKVGANENGNSLHGGFCGFDKKVWEAEEKDCEEPALKLTTFSPDGEEGFPGDLKVCVTYTVTKENSLKIEYFAVSDKDTVVNMTNHTYFNLSGYNSGTIEDEKMQIMSSFYTPNDDECMPTGEVLSVEGTPFDFRNEKAIGTDINSDFEQVKKFGGYDHNFVIDGQDFRLATVSKSEKTGIKMETWTDAPSMQLYTANALAEGIYKGGSMCGVHSAYCLETQCFPNAMKYRHYPNPFLKANEEYKTVTEYKFDIVK